MIKQLHFLFKFHIVVSTPNITRKFVPFPDMKRYSCIYQFQGKDRLKIGPDCNLVIIPESFITMYSSWYLYLNINFVKVILALTSHVAKRAFLCKMLVLHFLSLLSAIFKPLFQARCNLILLAKSEPRRKLLPYSRYGSIILLNCLRDDSLSI